jgi:histidinol-phosphate aminotransferase
MTPNHNDHTNGTQIPIGIRPAGAVARITPYGGSAQTPIHLPHRERVAKLDWNECARPPAPSVLRALGACVTEGHLNWYPDVEATELRNALSDYTGCDPETIRVFGGADAALEYIARTFLETGDQVLWCPPTYDNFRVYVESCGASLQPAPLRSIWEPEPGALLAGVTPQTRLVYLVNPNNPTGTLYSTEQIAALLWTCPDVGFVVDESYFEFSGISVAALTLAHPNLIVVRSFAKAFGLAGLRVGYCISHPDNLEAIDRIRVGKNTSTLAQVAATAALADRAYLDATVAETRLSMKTLAETCEQIGLTTRTTPANFILVRVADPDSFCRFLANRLIFVRNRNHLERLSGFVRITVGNTQTTERLVAAFRAAPSSMLYGQKTAGQRLILPRRSEHPVAPSTSRITPEHLHAIEHRAAHKGEAVA